MGSLDQKELPKPQTIHRRIHPGKAICLPNFLQCYLFWVEKGAALYGTYTWGRVPGQMSRF